MIAILVDTFSQLEHSLIPLVKSVSQAMEHVVVNYPSNWVGCNVTSGISKNQIPYFRNFTCILVTPLNPISAVQIQVERYMK